ncbi:hypothetical protein GVN24_34810 [Rhizobium sp. CRIBSB]|nr:hypothetical protein [Rhizobium sp. CRIBSB]
MTPEDKLNALFAAERPRTPDYGFQAAVAQKLALRRAWLTVLASVPWAMAAMSGLWALQPVIEPLRDSLNVFLPTVAGTLLIAAATAVAGLWLARSRGRIGFRR